MTSGILIVIDASALEYIQTSDVAFYLAMVPLILLTCTVILTEGAEMALSLWRVERRFVPAFVSSNGRPKFPFMCRAATSRPRW